MESKLMVSHSQLGVWDRCRFSFHLGYTLGWVQKEEPIYFTRGGLIHEWLAEYYNRIKDVEINLGSSAFLIDEMQKALAQGVDPILVNQVGYLVRRYIEDYSVFEDKGINIVEVEKHLVVDLTTPKGREFSLQGIVDMVLQDLSGNYWLRDHKSCGNAKFWSESEVLMDSQLPTYAAILRRHGMEVFGMDLNFLNTYDYKDKNAQSPDKLFKRMRTYRTATEQDNMLYEVGLAVDDIIDNRDNPRRSLKKDCAKCQFQDPCLLSMKGLDISTVMSANFKQKDQEIDDSITASDSDFADF